MAGRLMAGGRKAPRERDTAAAIAPEEVRAIRERLGLTQAEASELLGGGPRAFTKYEAGTVKPAAAVVTLLRLLEHDPATLRPSQERWARSVPGHTGRGTATTVCLGWRTNACHRCETVCARQP